jgi:hypothetical protein
MPAGTTPTNGEPGGGEVNAPLSFDRNATVGNGILSRAQLVRPILPMTITGKVRRIELREREKPR